MANEQTFLKLLVAQLKNQHPESPPDLAQGEEVTIQSRQDLDSIKNTLSAAQAATTAPALAALITDSDEIA